MIVIPNNPSDEQIIFIDFSLEIKSFQSDLAYMFPIQGELLVTIYMNHTFCVCLIINYSSHTTYVSYLTSPSQFLYDFILNLSLSFFCSILFVDSIVH